MGLMARLRRLEADSPASQGVTAGTAAGNKSVVLDANLSASGINELQMTVAQAGKAGTAGTVRVFPGSSAKGHTDITMADNAGNTTTIVTLAAMAAARTLTIPDPGGNTSFVMGAGDQTIAGNKTMSNVLGLSAGADVAAGQAYKADGVALSNVKWVDVNLTAAVLDSAGNVTVIAGGTGDQFKVRDVILVGGGTNFAAGGNRNISLTDGTTTYTTIANADIEAAPAASLRLGDTKVPFLTGTINTPTTAGSRLRFQYSGGTTDHSATGNISASVCIEKVA